MKILSYTILSLLVAVSFAQGIREQKDILSNYNQSNGDMSFSRDTDVIGNFTVTKGKFLNHKKLTVQGNIFIGKNAEFQNDGVLVIEGKNGTPRTEITPATYSGNYMLTGTNTIIIPSASLYVEPRFRIIPAVYSGSILLTETGSENYTPNLGHVIIR